MGCKIGYIDFHSHLDMKKFDGKRKIIIDECFNQYGFSTLVVVADPYEKNSPLICHELCEYNPNVYTMIAAHPHEAKNYSSKIEDSIKSFLKYKKTIAVGEAGLDFYYNHSPKNIQIEVFKNQIKIAQEFNKPLVIHSRESEPEVLSILKEVNFELPVVFHSYTGNLKNAQEIIKRGYYLSFSGIITFNNSEYLRDIVKIVPLDQIFAETDSPYLTPVPHRGKTNTPQYVREVYNKISQIKNISPDNLNKYLVNNFKRIFLNPKEVI